MRNSIVVQAMRHRDGKIKVQHGIIEGLKSSLKKLEGNDHIKGIIPGEISKATKGKVARGAGVHFSITVPLNGPGRGWKAIAKTASARQEIFIKTELSKDQVHDALTEAGLKPIPPSKSNQATKGAYKLTTLLQVLLVALLTVCLQTLSASQIKTWSNRAGLTLTQVVPSNNKKAPAIYAAERPFVWNNIDVGGRSAIFRITEGPNKGGLLVHSPVNLDADLQVELKKLGGGVKVVIAPNYEHLKYSKQWAEAFPAAEMWACPGLPERMPEVRWSKEMRTETVGDFELVWFDCESNPVTGKSFFNEVVFFYKPLKALFMSDVYWNYPGDLPSANYATEMAFNGEQVVPEFEVPFNTKAWKFGMDKVYRPFYLNVMTLGRKEQFAACREKIFSFDTEIIVPCHGDIIRGKDLCKRVLMEHFG